MFTIKKVIQRLAATPPAAVAVDEIYRYDVTAVDPDRDRLSFDLAYAPAGMAIDADSGRIAWRPTSEQVGTHPVYVRVTDSRGGMDLQIYDLVVTSTNDPPAFSSTPLTTAATGQPYAYPAQATDPNGDVLTYTLDAASQARGLTIAAITAICVVRRDFRLGVKLFGLTILALIGAAVVTLFLYRLLVVYVGPHIGK